MLVLGTPEHVELGFKLQTQAIPIAVYFNFLQFLQCKTANKQPQNNFCCISKNSDVGDFGHTYKILSKTFPKSKILFDPSRI